MPLPQIASAEAGGVRLALELLQPPATVRTAALELLQELLGGLLNPPVLQAFAMVRHMTCLSSRDQRQRVLKPTCVHCTR